MGGSWGCGGGLRRAEERARKGWGVENGDAVRPHTAQAPALLWHLCHCWLQAGPLRPSLSVARGENKHRSPQAVTAGSGGMTTALRDSCSDPGISQVHGQSQAGPPESPPTSRQGGPSPMLATRTAVQPGSWPLWSEAAVGIFPRGPEAWMPLARAHMAESPHHPSPPTRRLT